MRSGAEAGSSTGGMPLWLKGVLPLALLGVLLAVFLRFGPLGVFQAAFPPVEELTIDRVSFPTPDMIRLDVVNGGPEPVTVSQVMVNEAYWDFEITPGPRLGRLDDAVVTIPFTWVDGEPVEVTLVTHLGTTFSAEVPVATRSPAPDARYLATFALLGVYVGVIPVFLGLLWLPFLAGIAEQWLHFFLSFTGGMLIFLGVDALAEGAEIAERVAPAFQGLGLLLIGLVATPLLIEAVGHLRRKAPDSGGSSDGASESWRVAGLIALGIGLHNLGEGLAIGSSYAVGEIALGTTLVVGFLIHNTTEGIGIVAPVAREKLSVWRLVALGAIAGLPTIAGAWIGGFSYSPAATVLFLGVGAGAVAQVVWTLWKFMARRAEASGVSAGLAAPLNALGLVAGLVVMYATGLLVPG